MIIKWKNCWKERPRKRRWLYCKRLKRRVRQRCIWTILCSRNRSIMLKDGPRGMSMNAIKSWPCIRSKKSNMRTRKKKMMKLNTMTPFSNRIYNRMINNSHSLRNHPRSLSMICSTTGLMSTFTELISLKVPLPLNKRKSHKLQWSRGKSHHLYWKTKKILNSYHNLTMIYSKTITSLTSLLRMMSQKTKRKAYKYFTWVISKNRRNKSWLVLSQSKKMMKLSHNSNILNKGLDRVHLASIFLAKTMNQSQERQ